MDYIEECMSLDITPLAEAGGIVSWIKRIYTGKDDDLLQQLDGELKHIRTPSQKEKALTDIAEFIAKAEKYRDSSKEEDVIWDGIVAAHFRGKNRESGDLAKYVASLHKIEQRIKQIKV